MEFSMTKFVGLFYHEDILCGLLLITEYSV